jgi:hypothetical protein
MDLFCFASRSVENIWLGVRARRWAVATVSSTQMSIRRTKAERYLLPGSRGVLYCNPTHSFTVPFVTESKADPLAVVADIWPEPWELPFHIKPLGNPKRQVPSDEAWKHWPILKKREKRAGGVSAAINITGTTVFVPVDITEEDGEIILEDLAIESSEP